MEFYSIIANVQIFLLVFARIFAIMQTAPLLSSSGIPQIAKIGLTLFTSFAVTSWMLNSYFVIPESALAYGLLIIGEILIGIIIGFYLQIIYSAFLVSGQFYSFQMGFGASVVYDPLAQIQLPLMGQFLNLLAMFIFISVGGFTSIFLKGIYRSFEVFRAYDLVIHKEYLIKMLIGGLGKLFAQALIISFPVLATLMLISVAMGLLAKAAPQMNLLMLGFPIKISIAFIILLITLPFIVDYFARIIDSSFNQILKFIELGSGAAI